MASSSEKITSTSPATFPGGCVEAEGEFETEVTEEKVEVAKPKEKLKTESQFLETSLLHPTRPAYLANFSYQALRNRLWYEGIEWASLREGGARQIRLAEPGHPADRVVFYYGSENEFQNLSVTVQGDAFAYFLEDHLGNLERGALTYLQSFLLDAGEIEVLYTHDGELSINGFQETIPDDLENALHFLALDYANGTFMNER